MAGDFSDIYLVLVPQRAAAGETVDIAVSVRNLLPQWPIFIAISGYYLPDDINIQFSPDCVTPDLKVDPNCPLIPGGGSQTFNGSFIMPDHDVKIWLSSWCWTGLWSGEEDLSYDVLLEALPPPPETVAKIVNFLVIVDGELKPIGEWTAPAGAYVGVAPQVRNQWTEKVWIQVAAQYNGQPPPEGPDIKEIPPGYGAGFGFFFTMPDSDVTFQAWTYWWDWDLGEWIGPDDTDSITIQLIQEAAFKELSAIYS